MCTQRGRIAGRGPAKAALPATHLRVLVTLSCNGAGKGETSGAGRQQLAAQMSHPAAHMPR